MDREEKVELEWESTEKPLKMQHPNTPGDIDYTCKLSDAFDNYFACLTVGKQLSNYYRYGEKRPCSKLWQKTKLCMKVKMVSEKSGMELMREYREKQEAERASQPNVFDVWTRRSPDNPAFPNSVGAGADAPEDGSTGGPTIV
ncbi:hypothetical protein EV178_001304 [Coemansia sp. RSA 1646]|nr:hypothetical protein EV178_001304 [Coemansia sp. RSA 1646]KAJ1772654.1 hypothetical protein LPJ74_001370 [Coemansia sp. RSA 1843]KAJ2090204.1 hypothetical protein IW138_002836 [Coemansia sp. RSA 986]KAJ2214610.1 hypothetical protein EV179_002869 [Coemansia sp. RSA 487]